MIREMTEAPEDLILYLRIMLAQLRRERLEVGLAEAEEQRHSGHKVRVVTGTNPEWYRELCSRYPSYRQHGRTRHHQTRISRKRIIRALERLTQCKGARSIYAEDLIELAQLERERDEEERQEYGETYEQATGACKTESEWRADDDW